ncbi:MAG: nitrilase-related carbon-nitrogen hydrolase, partial [Myxococcota bacterium]
MVRTLTAAMLSGLLLQLAASPVEWWWVSGFALVPVLVALEQRGGRDWLICGAVIGLMNGACVVDAGAKWGPTVVLFFVLFVTLLHVVPFALAGLLAPRMAEGYRPFAYMGSWLLFVWCMDEFIYTPVLLSAPVALHSRLALSLVPQVGIIGLEALVVGISVGLSVGWLIGGPGRRRSVHLRNIATPRRWGYALAAAAAVVSAVLLAGAWSTPLHSKGQGRLVGVQPNIHWMDFSASGWSLERRRHIERTLDSMTIEAARKAGSKGTIVWPENGNSLPNAQLSRRKNKLASILASTGADLLAPGHELVDGRSFLSVFRFAADKVTARARKAHLLPMAESDLSAGHPTVIDSHAGALGVAICYDVLFSGHVRSLARQGAEILIVTTDDTSFGLSSVPRRHLSYAILRAAEVGRPMLFVSNEGPSSSYEPIGHTVRVYSKDRARTVYEVELPRMKGQTPAVAGFRHGVVMLLVVGLVLALRTKPLGACRHLSWPAYAAPVLATVLGITADFGARAAYTRGGFSSLIVDL